MNNKTTEDYVHVKRLYEVICNHELGDDSSGVQQRVEIIRELEKGGWIERTKLGGLYRYNNLYRLAWKYDNCHSDKVTRDHKER